MRNRVLITLALVATVVVAPAGAAHAQCGSALSTEESLAQTEVAFVARVIDRSNRDRTAVMEVLEVWKGSPLPPTVVVNGGPEDLDQHTTVDRVFLLGQIYLVMPANSRAPFQDSLCSGSQLWPTPNGSIPTELQLAAGNRSPIPIAVDGESTTGAGNMGGGLLGTAAVAVGVLLAALAVIYGVRRLSSPRRKPRRSAGSVGVGTGIAPEAAFKRRRRRMARLSMPSVLESKRGSRLEQVRRATRRGRRAPSDHEREQLERAVKLTATAPPSRRNHYTSGRRSAP